MKLIFRQGDILLEKLDQSHDGTTITNMIGKEYEECKDEKIVARGEATGHNHSFSEDSQVLLFKKQGTMMEEPELLKVKDEYGGAVLTHQEHLPIQIPKGVYKIKREVEYNPFTLQLNKVRD